MNRREFIVGSIGSAVALFTPLSYATKDDENTEKVLYDIEAERIYSHRSDPQLYVKMTASFAVEECNAACISPGDIIMVSWPEDDNEIKVHKYKVMSITQRR